MAKKALIQGTRICQIEDTEFPVSADLSWVEVSDDTTTKDTYEDGAVVKFSTPISTYWTNLRNQRDSLLANCDWTVAADTALSDSKKAEWVSYRTKLRDFPSTLNDTKVQEFITWPTKPE
tara:strand:+ start:1161 stop:1520 length:360 start_codon:yes stop_codon:yes gene_type:complete